MVFKIHKVEVTPSKSYHSQGAINVLVEFTPTIEEDGSVWLSTLGETHGAMTPDYKLITVRGSDKIEKDKDYPEEENRYFYCEYLADCLVIRAAIIQLAQMKEEIDNNLHHEGDPLYAPGCFRSGDPYHDFLGLLETLDRFWD